MNEKDKQDILQFIKQGDSFLVVCHENPDGDALGSLMGLTLILLEAGKKAAAVCVHPVPYTYQLLPQPVPILAPEKAPDYDNVIFVDCADLERAGSAASFFAQKPMANIDHHSTNDRFGSANWIECDFASTTELVLELALALGVSLTKDTAECLLIGLSADTGHFSYSNTNALALSHGAILLSHGVNMQIIHDQLYNRSKYAATLLIARAIDSLQLLYGGRAALMILSQEDFAETGSLASDAEGLIDFARNIDTVEVAALLRETATGGVKGSLRSKGTVDVAEIAKEFNGGGHRAASGFSMAGPLEEATAPVIAAMGMALPR